MIELTAENRKELIEAMLTVIPTLSDEALRHIVVVLLDEARIKNQGGVDSE